ncbi:hypothetical protein [Brevundimonas sp.]|uniref:hypothetical protein n=1 Tax=Brevundimonas sp. TaxID=1871086 RepID=UPI002D672AEF|nr:hypothetical protein [Brevundimonas sp.]HYD26359.1 hypothetical protein [Brevundimonas sp.]
MVLLTLNVLLSFAQFEREVTGERISDKIAASKAKGMWMGGLPPLGYDPPTNRTTRTLVRNEAEVLPISREMARENQTSIHRIKADLREEPVQNGRGLKKPQARRPGSGALLEASDPYIRRVAGLTRGQTLDIGGDGRGGPRHGSQALPQCGNSSFADLAPNTEGEICLTQRQRQLMSRVIEKRMDDGCDRTENQGSIGIQPVPAEVPDHGKMLAPA